MVSSDAISYIPLFCTAVVAVIITVLITVIKVRKTAKVSFIAYFALAVVIFACIYTATHPSMLRFSLFMLLTSLLFIPYCIMIAFGKQKLYEREEVEESEPEEVKPEVVVEEIQVEKIDLIEKGKKLNKSEFIKEKENTIQNKEDYKFKKIEEMKGSIEKENKDEVLNDKKSKTSSGFFYKDPNDYSKKLLMNNTYGFEQNNIQMIKPKKWRFEGKV